jgi:hypothetical protein
VRAWRSTHWSFHLVFEVEAELSQTFLQHDTTFLQSILVNRKPTMEQRTLKNVNNCLNTNIYSHMEASGGQSSSLYFIVVHFFNNSVN